MARNAIKRGKMNYRDELCIQKNIKEIEEEIEAKKLTGLLFAKEIIDMDDMGSIDTGPSRLERARRLLKIIMLRGPLAFQKFLESLEVTGYKELVALLKGTQSHISEHDVKGFIKDEEKAKDLDVEVQMLKQRIGQVEKSGAQREDLVVLRHDVEDALKNVNITLQKIEELSQANRETTDTINSLRKELDKKEELLAEARRHIQALRTKVSSLETKNEQLQRTVRGLEGQVRSNKESSDKKFQEMEAEKEITDERLAKMEVDQKQILDMMKSLDPSGKKEPKVRKKPQKIVPRNRFQNK